MMVVEVERVNRRKSKNCHSSIYLHKYVFPFQFSNFQLCLTMDQAENDTMASPSEQLSISIQNGKWEKVNERTNE